jgi:hypothetical protein
VAGPAHGDILDDVLATGNVTATTTAHCLGESRLLVVLRLRYAKTRTEGQERRTDCEGKTSGQVREISATQTWK